MIYSQFSRQIWRIPILPYLFLFFLIFVSNTNASSSKVDSNFYPIIDGDGTTYAIAIQSDGKILVGGSISKANGEEQSGIARLNPDGSVDTSFSIQGSNTFNGLVYDIALQNDGKILIVGMFTNVQGQTQNHIARLNPNGSLDTSFLNGLSGPNAPINAVEVQLDGKIIIGGNFSLFNNEQRNGFVRLNSDGSIDNSFFNSSPSLVNSVKIQPDGKILIGGRFGEVALTERRKIARLNSDGTLDTSFLNNLSGANNDVTSVNLQADGKILVGGAFTSFNSVSRNRIARLNTDGSLDTSFLDNLSGANNLVNIVTQQTDGKILIGGSFSSINGLNQNRIALLNNDGSLDSTFTNILSDAPENTINAIAFQSDGKIIIGGRFYFVSQTLREGIARLNPDGMNDPTFAFVQLHEPGTIRHIARQADGKILISGTFRFVNGVYTENLGRINQDGSLDSTFSVGSNISTFEQVNAIVPLPDGKILIGGNFDIFSQIGEYRDLARLNSDGSLDTTFTIGNTNGSIESIFLQSDGKFIVGGGFSFINDTARNNLARLNADGTVDTSFLDNLSGPNSFVLSSLIQSDNKIVIIGAFSQVNGISRSGIARLNSDGTIDTTFTGNTNGLVRDIEQQNDGKFIVGGDFTAVNGTSRNRIVRLNTNGSVDTTFLNGLSGADGEVLDVAYQGNGKIVIAGNFTSVNGVTKKLARLNVDGSLDQSFNFNLLPSNAVTYSLLTEPNGNLLVGGYFNKVNGITRASLFRSVKEAQIYDFDGDGKSDVSVFRPSDGFWYLLRSENGFSATPFGLSTDKITPADFDGDGKTDIAVFRDGNWFWLNSSNNAFNAYQFGVADDIPVPADYNGDGRAELAVFRSGNWYTLNLANNQFQGVQFGIPSDKPVAADYDGDGKVDFAVVRQSGGASFWYILGTNQGFYGLQFGFDTDKLVPSDYDGDGKTDIAVYRNGNWYIQGSSQGFYAIQFGIASDIPVPADYDGDGKSDVAVFRNGNWYWLNSGSNNSFSAVQWGINNDKPIPAAYLP